ncbi:hypothetical protein PRUPE_6G133700 [Prunus persica]|uniref:At2g29880-like C-terminal domain-containing protein n=1 Tax=Prunus persica TaxID=3760 RepID=A0A251NPU2_PRUPE|nr:hypothetical protein PRUPE_6G133700 [Prunus persica]
MLLQLMVDAASRGWRDANGMLSKATVETKILLKINEKLSFSVTALGLGGIQPFTAPEEVWKDYFKSHPKDTNIQTKTSEDCEDMQIVIGNATAIGRNSLGLGDDTDARTFRADDRHVGIEDFVFDDESKAFIPNHNKPPHQDPPLGHSSSSLPFQATNCEDLEGNAISNETTQQAMGRISLSIDSITTDFRGNYMWDAIKETPNLDERARYKAPSLLNTNTKKDAFLKMSPQERSNWISYNLE